MNKIPLRGDALANRFQLCNGQLLRTVRHIEEHTFEFIEHAGQSGVALLERRLPIQAVFFQQVFGTALLGGDVHLLGARSVLRSRIRQFHEYHFRAAEMFADGQGQHALPNIGSIRNRFRRPDVSPGQEGHNYQRCDGCEGC